MQWNKQKSLEKVLHHCMGPPPENGHRDSWKGKPLSIRLVYKKAHRSKKSTQRTVITTLNSSNQSDNYYGIFTNDNQNIQWYCLHFHWWVRRLSLQHVRTFQSKIIKQKKTRVLLQRMGSQKAVDVDDLEFEMNQRLRAVRSEWCTTTAISIK